jgi:hypothetical protein
VFSGVTVATVTANTVVTGLLTGTSIGLTNGISAATGNFSGTVTANAFVANSVSINVALSLWNGKSIRPTNTASGISYTLGAYENNGDPSYKSLIKIENGGLAPKCTISSDIDGQLLIDGARIGGVNPCFIVRTEELVVDTAATFYGIMVVDNGEFTTLSSSRASVSGTVTANEFDGNGTKLTALNATNLTSGTVGSARITGDYAGITGLGALTSELVVTDKGISAVSGNFSGTVVANAFSGDGSLLTNIVVGTPADDSVTSAKIVNGTIEDGDISVSAAIAFSKLSILKEDITGLGIPGSDTNTTYTAGTGLNLDSTMFSIAETVVTSNYNSGLTVNGTVTANTIISTSTLGFGSGAGGTVTQATDKSTAVTINKSSGKITMNNASLAGGATASFTVNNSNVSADDVVLVTTSGGFTSTYKAVAMAVQSGEFVVEVTNTGTTQSEALTINFVVIKGSVN